MIALWLACVAVNPATDSDAQPTSATGQGGPATARAGDLQPDAPSPHPLARTPCAAPSLDTELLVDGDFESASAGEWVGGDTPCEWVVDTTSPAGDAILSGGTGGSCEGVQTVSLAEHDLCDDAIDSHALSVRLSAFVRTADSPTADNGDRGPGEAVIFDDHAWVEVRCLDAGGALLASFLTPVGDGPEWLSATAGGVLPAGTRSLEIAAVAQHRRGDRNDGAVDGLTLVVTEAPVLDGTLSKLPVLYAGEPGELVVLWETSGATEPQGLSLGLAGASLEPWPGAVETTWLADDRRVHRVFLAGLAPGTPYTYQVGSAQGLSATYEFRTPPASGDVRLAVTGDNQVGAGVFTQVVEAVASEDVDLFFSVGDIVQDGLYAQDWDTQWFAPLEQEELGQTTPILFARGNHDHEWTEAFAYTTLPGNGSWFATRLGDLFVVALDSQWDTVHGAELSDQQAFLQAALASDDAKDALFRIVAFHIPSHSNVWKTADWDGDPAIRADWVPAFESGGVDLVLAGHAHAYQRGELNGVTYVVTGGAGGTLDTRSFAHWDHLGVIESSHHYGLLALTDDVLSWRALTLDGTRLDAFTLGPR